MKPILIAAACISALLGACKKENVPLPPPPPAVNARIAIKLNQTYLPAEKLDSAILVWETAGGVQQEKMQLSNDTVFTEIKKLNKGEGTLTIQLFSKVELRTRNLQWEKRAVVTLKDQESLNLSAPANFDDADWLPRVILIDNPSNFTAIVALRPADPYFLLKNVPPGFKIELERHYVAIPGGALIVGGGLWKCNSVCTDDRGIIENREFFTPLPAQIGNQPWKMVEVGIGLFGPNYTPGPGFYFNHW